MRKNKGFTLIELLVAIFILVIGIVAVLQAFPFGVNVQKQAQMATVALQLNQEKMEEIISYQYNEILVGTIEESYGFDPDFPSFKRITEVEYFNPDSPEVPPAEDSGIKKIEVTIFWHTPLGTTEKEIKLATLIAKR